MGRHLSTYVACACVALSHFFTAPAPALAQETDGRVLIGAGIAPLSIVYARSKTDGSPSRTKTIVHTGLGEQAALAAGYGIGSWVLALEASFSYEVEDEGAVAYDYAFAERSDIVTKRTALELGPSVRYLFIDGTLRPFVEVGAGIGFESIWNNQRGQAIEGTSLYARGGPGVQVRLADAVSLDLALRVGYASTSGERESDIVIIGSRINTTTGLYSPVYSTHPDYTVQQVSADLVARLSIWP